MKINFKLWKCAFIQFFISIFLSQFQFVSAATKPSGCSGLIGELQLMKKAQNQIISSLAQNHEMFASQLNDLSFELALYKKSVPQKALVSMEKSAQAYRARSVKAQESANQLDDATDDLIKRIQRCLK